MFFINNKNFKLNSYGSILDAAKEVTGNFDELELERFLSHVKVNTGDNLSALLNAELIRNLDASKNLDEYINLVVDRIAQSEYPPTRKNFFNKMCVSSGQIIFKSNHENASLIFKKLKILQFYDFEDVFKISLMVIQKTENVDAGISLLKYACSYSYVLDQAIDKFKFNLEMRDYDLTRIVGVFFKNSNFTDEYILDETVMPDIISTFRDVFSICNFDNARIASIIKNKNIDYTDKSVRDWNAMHIFHLNRKRAGFNIDDTAYVSSMILKNGFANKPNEYFNTISTRIFIESKVSLDDEFNTFIKILSIYSRELLLAQRYVNTFSLNPKIHEDISNCINAIFNKIIESEYYKSDKCANILDQLLFNYNLGINNFMKSVKYMLSHESITHKLKLDIIEVLNNKIELNPDIYNREISKLRFNLEFSDSKVISNNILDEDLVNTIYDRYYNNIRKVITNNENWKKYI